MEIALDDVPLAGDLGGSIGMLDLDPGQQQRFDQLRIRQRYPADVQSSEQGRGIHVFGGLIPDHRDFLEQRFVEFVGRELSASTVFIEPLANTAISPVQMEVIDVAVVVVQLLIAEPCEEFCAPRTGFVVQ